MSSELIPYEVYSTTFKGKDVKAIYLGKIYRFKSDPRIIAFRNGGSVQCHRLRTYTFDGKKLEVNTSLVRNLSKFEEEYLDALLKGKKA